MIETQTYHRDAFGLPSIALPTGRIKVRPSQHAKAMAAERDIVIPTQVNMHVYDIIEVTLFKGKLVKLTVRSKKGMYDLDNDLCMVISVYYGDNSVKTVWLNHHLDTHRTLDKSKYARP